MLFNSLTYLVFMLLLAPAAVFGPAWLRRSIFLWGSLLFYAFWRIDFTFLVVFTAFVDWFGASRIAASDDPKVRKTWITLSLVMNLTVLGFFKYFYFMVDSVAGIADLFGVHFELNLPFKIILPLGISFYTFHSLSYVFDVYRRVIPPVPKFYEFLTYVMFWTQLVAGPILRAAEVVPQLENYRRPTRGEVVYGLEEILQGLFKKLVIADQVGQIVDAGFAIPVNKMGTLDAWTLAFLFGFQIYFDFAGYSSIALGSARVMGFHFPPNFNWPYLASSPKEFWKRWHISLSSWIRDYLYLPLQGAKFKPAAQRGLEASGEDQVSAGRRTFALFATWFIMGLWHGANWTFALWGIWHASMVWVHRAGGPLFERFPMWFRRVGGWAFTLGFAMLGWIFFRARTMHDSLAMVATAFNPMKLRVRALRENDYLVAFVVLVAMLCAAGVTRYARSRPVPPALKYPFMAAATAVMFFGVFLCLRQVQQFIYFQF